jgi:hypothetical protein
MTKPSMCGKIIMFTPPIRCTFNGEVCTSELPLLRASRKLGACRSDLFAPYIRDGCAIQPPEVVDCCTETDYDHNPTYNGGVRST